VDVARHNAARGREVDDVDCPERQINLRAVIRFSYWPVAVANGGQPIEVAAVAVDELHRGNLESGLGCVAPAVEGIAGGSQRACARPRRT